MSGLGVSLIARLVAAALLSAAVVVSAAETEDNKPQRSTLFVGVDTSGSFRFAYDDALTFLGYYLYGHMHELGGLAKPRDLFLRIHPEVRPGVPGPHELAGRARHAGDAVSLADGEAEPERVAWRPEQKLARGDGRADPRQVV